jgi:hypothetical protein
MHPLEYQFVSLVSRLEETGEASFIESEKWIAALTQGSKGQRVKGLIRLIFFDPLTLCVGKSLSRTITWKMKLAAS